MNPSYILLNCLTLLLSACVGITQAETSMATSKTSFVLTDTDKGVDGLNNPRDIALSKDKKWLFVASADDNALSVFKINDDFSLTHQQTIKSSKQVKLEGALSVVTDSQSQNVYVLSYYHSALLHFSFDEASGLTLKHTLSDNLPFQQVFKQPDTIQPKQDTMGILGGYELHIDHLTNQLFIASTVSHGVSVFDIDKNGTPTLTQRINTMKDNALSGAVSVTTDDSGQFLAVAGMNGKAVSIYTKNVTGTFEYTQTIKHQFEMPISVTFAQNGQYLLAVDAMTSGIVVFQQRNNQSYELMQVMSKTEHGINGLNKVAFLKDNESIMTFSEQSHRIDKFELIDSALNHTQTLSVPSLQSATSLELLDSHHAVSTWAKSDALAVFKIAETKKGN